MGDSNRCATESASAGIVLRFNASEKQIYVSTTDFLKLAQQAARKAKKLPENMSNLMTHILKELEMQDMQLVLQKFGCHQDPMV
ncbi:MAG: hypothetical protein NTV34_03225 [Proteobacteria bacterium]|nr:hypothetical protein [Pseudomonadota bacterium]